MFHTRVYQVLFAVGIGLTGAFHPGSAKAATYTWNRTDTGAWEDTGSWSLPVSPFNGIPGGGDIAQFSGMTNPTVQVTTFESSGGQQTGGMTFDTSSQSWTIIDSGGANNRALNLIQTSGGFPSTTTVSVAGSSTNTATLSVKLISNPVANGLNKTGAGILVLSNATNSYSGATVISDGTLRINALANGSSVSNIGQSSNLASNLVLNGGALQYTGSIVSTDRLFQLGTTAGSKIENNGSGAINFTNTGSMGLLGTGTRTLTLGGTNTGANTLAAVIGDNGGATSLTKADAGTWVLTGTNTYTGATTVSNGTLQLGDGTTQGNIANTSGVALSLSTSTLAFNNPSPLDFTSGISGAGKVTKDGAGTLTFNTTGNSYSGITDINAGKLYVNVASSGTGAVTAKIGTTLGGNGSVGGSVAVQSATLDPGNATNAIGKLTLGNSLTFTGTSTYSVNVTDLSAPSAGTTYDQVAATSGTVSLAGSLTFATVTFTGNTTGYTSTTRLTIIDGSSLSGTFSNYADGQHVTALSGLGGFSEWSIYYDTSAGDVYLTPTPEPGAVVAVAAAGLGLARWVRRRRTADQTAPAVPV